MRSRIAPLLVAALTAVGLASCAGDDEASPTTTATTTPSTITETTTTDTQATTTPAGPTIVRITVVDGVPKGGILRATMKQNQFATIVVKSDVADEIHLHGYDLSVDVNAGGTARLRFHAHIPGRFEVELEERGTPIADLTVEP